MWSKIFGAQSWIIVSSCCALMHEKLLLSDINSTYTIIIVDSVPSAHRVSSFMSGMCSFALKGQRQRACGLYRRENENLLADLVTTRERIFTYMESINMIEFIRTRKSHRIVVQYRTRAGEKVYSIKALCGRFYCLWTLKKFYLELKPRWEIWKLNFCNVSNKC